MNIAEFEQITDRGGKAAEAWAALEAAHTAFEAASATGSRELWRTALRVIVVRCEALLAAQRALLEADGE